MRSNNSSSPDQHAAQRLFLLILAIGWLCLAGCSKAQVQPPTKLPPLGSGISVVETSAVQPTPVNKTDSTVQPVLTTTTATPAAPSSSVAEQPDATPTQPLPPEADDWMSQPIIPSVSETARQIYQRGLAAGRNPHAFSKVGDCQSITTYFLKLFDLPGYYQLGDQAYLQETIDWFAGSFERESLAVKGGLNAAAMLSPLRANPQVCQAGESPLACELRINNPSIAIISLEEWWADDPTKYERYMRQIIDYTLSQEVLPILATKADNLEGNHLINQTIAELAWEYNLPLWNFWLAVQPLPYHGLVQETVDGKPDLFHLTHSVNFYNYTDLGALKAGWAMRNLTALQVLDAVRRGLNESTQP